MGCSGLRPAFVLLFRLLEKTPSQSVYLSAGALGAGQGPSLSLHPPLRPPSLYLIPHLSASSAGFLCPTPFPGRTQGNLRPGEPICSVVPSDTCEDAHWGCLSAEAGSGESLTSGGFGSSGGKGEGGVPGCGHSYYGGMEPRVLTASLGNRKD